MYVCMYVCMYGGMDGWRDGRRDGPTDRWIDGCIMPGCFSLLIMIQISGNSPILAKYKKIY